MSNPAPPPVPASAPRPSRNRVGYVVAVLAVLVILAVPALYYCNVFRAFSIPTDGMAPAIQRGDRVLMKGYLFGGAPRRGDIVIFKTDGLAQGVTWNVPPGQFFNKRVAGEPGDRLRIEAGKLFINDKPVAISNAVGEISYMPGPMSPGNITVPANCYFVLGDNTASSLDSRYFGPISRKSIIGRITMCYGPSGRAGPIK